MTTKNLGPGVSGYDVPDGRAWETVVFNASKAVLDKELNLVGDIDINSGQLALKRSIPSGWLSDDFLGTSSPTSAIFSTSAVANQLLMPNSLTAHVNGWMINVLDTNATGSNLLDLGASPAGAGVRRTDIVFLEVWRRLISAAPSAVGKSASARIWQNGNVKTDPANDLTLNFPDDLEDINVGSETTKRVQIQYRLRTMQGINLFTYPYGLDDPTVVAHSVPTNAATPDGVATLFGYSNQSANGDPGLWVAGDGNPANTLGTVDGYMYAIPLTAVFRRNTTAFNRRTNQNGGVATPGPSDRPDGFFYDIFVSRDIKDLRLGVAPSWSLPEILDKNFNFLLDNNIFTEIVDTSPSGGGYVGATVFAADEIGVSTANGGDGITTGTTGVGGFIGEFDAVRRRFSDRAIYETVTVKIPVPGGGWVSGATVTIDPTALPVYPYSAFNWSAHAPSAVTIIDVEDAWWIGVGSPKKTRSAFLTNSSAFSTIVGIGQNPVVPITITMSAVVSTLSLTNESLYVDLLIAYPTHGGLSKTPTNTFGAGTFAINNPGQLPAGAPVSFSAFANETIDSTHREVQLEYQTVALTITQSADTSGAAISTFKLPERALSIVSVLKNAVPIVGGTTISASGRVITLTNALDYTSPGDNLTIQYHGIRPLPQNNEQMTIYYEARAPQAARGSLLGTSITVTPRYVGPHLYAITTGSGSQDEGYPFPQAYAQTGGIYPASGGVYSGEGDLSARGDVSITEFNASTGFLRLPVYVPMVANPESLVFTRGLGDIDIEGRSYFKTVPGGYIPNAYSQDLSDPKRHKDVLPIIAELSADSALGFKGELVLVLLIRYALFDETNGVFFNSDLTQNTTTASVFRLKGNLLNKRLS